MAQPGCTARSWADSHLFRAITTGRIGVTVSFLSLPTLRRCTVDGLAEADSPPRDRRHRRHRHSKLRPRSWGRITHQGLQLREAQVVHPRLAVLAEPVMRAAGAVLVLVHTPEAVVVAGTPVAADKLGAVTAEQILCRRGL